MTDIGPLASPRRGVPIGALLLWMILAGAGGAIAWDIYENEVRSRFGIVREETSAPVARQPANSDSGTLANDEIVALVKDLQASQKHTADELETALQLLTSEQASSKATADALAALSAKVDALQRAKVDTLQRPMVPAAKRLAPIAPRKPPAAAGPPVVSPEPNEPEAPGAPPSSDVICSMLSSGGCARC